MKYVLVKDLAEYYVPINDYWEYDNYEQQSEKHDAKENAMEIELFTDWSNRCGVDANEDYVWRTYCDQLADHRPQIRGTQEHTIFMPINGHMFFEI